MAKTRGITLLRCSSWYISSPVGLTDQQDFINGVAEIRTFFKPRDLLSILQGIEEIMGRKRGPRWGPREIDLDIILYGQEVVQEGDLVIPHSEYHRRRFVLEPLCEIAPDVIHPCFGVSARVLLDRLESDGKWVKKLCSSD